MKNSTSTTPLMLSAKSSITSNASFVLNNNNNNNADDPRPARLRLSYGMRRKGSNLTNSSSIERPRTHVGRQRCFSGDSLAHHTEPISFNDDYQQTARDSIDDALENLDIELTEYEKLIMNKYLQEMQPQPICSSDVDPIEDRNENVVIVTEPLSEHDDALVLTRFPVNDPIDYGHEYFPAKDQKYSFAHYASQQLPSHRLTSNDNNSDASTSSPTTDIYANQSFGFTGEVRNCRARIVNRIQPNNRSALRKNFSIWVGVTSCVWGLLLYLDKSYF